MLGRGQKPSVRETIKVLEATLKILNSLKQVPSGAKPYFDMEKNRTTSPWEEENEKCKQVHEYLREAMLREKNDVHMRKGFPALQNDFTNMLVTSTHWLDHFKKTFNQSLSELKQNSNKYNEEKLSRAVRIYMRLPSEWEY